MNQQELNALWHLVQNSSLGTSELFVHTTGIRSLGFDLCVGCDQQMRRHLLVPLQDGMASPSFRSAGLFVRNRPLLRDGIERQYLDLVCLVPALNEVFSHLVLDVLGAIVPEDPRAVETCLSILEQWQELFGSGGSALGREQILGLLGELIVLERLTTLNPAALACWEGPAGGIHDFRSGRLALEVKASTRRHGRFFVVNGHQQLEAPVEGELHFVSLKLERVDGGALSIPNLVDRVRRHGVDPIAFTEKLRTIGYAAGVSEEADSARFDLNELGFYQVDDRFPRIVAASFSGGQPPSGVLRITYEIDISGEIPEALSESAAENYLQRFARGGAP